MTRWQRNGAVVLASLLAGCTAPKRPGSLDNMVFPTITMPEIEESMLPKPAIPAGPFPEPVITGSTSRRIDDVTVEVKPGPYDKLQPFTRAWMADRGVYLFTIQVTNHSDQLASLGSVKIRLVAGDERVTAIGLWDGVGGDTTITSGRADQGLLASSYYAWLKAQKLDPDSVHRVFEEARRSFEATSSAAELTSEAQEVVQHVLADITKATTPGFVASLDILIWGDYNWTTARTRWNDEVQRAYIAWSSDLESERHGALDELGAREASVTKELAVQVGFDMDKINLSSEDLSTVNLLPNGDTTNVFLAFQVAPEKMGATSKLSLYGVPTQFDAAGNVVKKVNIDFPVVVR